MKALLSSEKSSYFLGLWMEGRLLTHPTQDRYSLSVVKYSQPQLWVWLDMLPSLLVANGGQVRADLDVWASAWVHFLNVQLYGLPTTNGHKWLWVMSLETLIWAWVKAQTPRSTLSRWSDAESSSSILRSSENRFIKIKENSGGVSCLRYFYCVDQTKQMYI